MRDNAPPPVSRDPPAKIMKVASQPAPAKGTSLLARDNQGPSLLARDSAPGPSLLARDNQGPSLLARDNQGLKKCLFYLFTL
jgi:hypothetical protein